MDNSKLIFKTPTVDDIPLLKEYTSRFYGTAKSCEASPVVMLMWNKYYSYKFAVSDGSFYLSAGVGKKQIFLLPFTYNMKESLETLERYANESNIKMRFLASDGERLDNFNSVSTGYSEKKVRNGFEYIYTNEQLAQLNGKRYHSKRNHIASFSRKYDWKYEQMSDDNIPQVINAADNWLEFAKNEFDDYSSADEENKGIKRILPYYNSLNIKGGILRIDGNIAAFCFGSPLNNEVFDVNVEKAMPNYRDAYPVINQQFVANTLKDFKYINREDDMGLPGLRKAKLSYNPEILLKKYLIEKV